MAIDTLLTYTVTLRDRFKVTDSVTFYVMVDQNAVTVKEIFDDCQFYGTLVDGVSDAQVVNLTITINPPLLESYKDAPGAESFIPRQGLMPGKTVFPQDSVTYAIPSADDSEIGSGGQFSGGGVDALAGALTTDSLTFAYTTKNGHAITHFLLGYVHTRKRRAMLLRSTKET